MKREQDSRTSLNVPIPESQGCQKKRESKKLKTYLNKERKKERKKENFLKLAKEIDMQVQSPNQVGSKEDHTKTHHN